MKKFFGLDNGYQFEWNDLRCFVTVVNVALIMIYGLSIAWFGLAVAVVGMIKDLAVDHRINGLIMHFANAILNIYFLFFVQARGRRKPPCPGAFENKAKDIIKLRK